MTDLYHNSTPRFTRYGMKALAFSLAVLIYSPGMSIDYRSGNVTVDWEEVSRCATQQLPNPNSREWPIVWHQVFECESLLMARHSGYVDGQTSSRKPDPYLPVLLSPNRPPSQ